MSKASGLVCCFFPLLVFLITGPHVAVPVPVRVRVPLPCQPVLLVWKINGQLASVVIASVDHLLLWLLQLPEHHLPPNLLHDSLAWVTSLCQFFGILPLISGFLGARACYQWQKYQSYSTQRLLTAPGKGRIGEIPNDLGWGRNTSSILILCTLN